MIRRVWALNPGAFTVTFLWSYLWQYCNKLECLTLPFASVVMLSVSMLNVLFWMCYSECVILNVLFWMCYAEYVIPNANILNFVMLSDIMLSVIMLSVVMLNVLCWMPIYWMSLCRVLLCWMSLCWVSWPHHAFSQTSPVQMHLKVCNHFYVGAPFKRAWKLGFA